MAMKAPKLNLEIAKEMIARRMKAKPAREGNYKGVKKTTHPKSKVRLHFNRGV